MILQLFLYTFLTLIFVSLISIYWKIIRPAKRIYDILRSQNIRSEPFIPIIGQLTELRRYREQGRLLEYHQALTNKHGLIYLFSVGPYPRLVIQEPDLIADILGRTQAHNYYKSTDFSFRLKPLTGIHNLLVSNGTEHERARKMLNPAFHFVNLQSMISIMTNQTAGAIDTLLLQASSSNQQAINL
jgi:cytochrome P450